MTDRKVTCIACKSAVTKGDIAGSDLEFGGELKATNQPTYAADMDTDFIATVGMLDAYTPMLRTSGNQTFSGIKKAGGSGYYRKQSATLNLETPPNGTITDENYVMEDTNGTTAVQMFNSYTANSQTIYQISTKYPFTEGGETKITNGMLWLSVYADKAVLFLRFIDKNGGIHLKTLGTVTEND